MADFTHKNRPIAVSTDLGEDKLLLEQFTMSEGLSRPFHMSLTMLAQPDYTLPFEKLLGQNASVRLDIPGRDPRYFHGVVFRISEGMQDPFAGDRRLNFIRYWAEVMPAFSKLTRNREQPHFPASERARYSQAKVLTGVDVTKDDIKGTYDPRDYCVQYRETDFQFASRLMEEEGIFYYFKHAEKQPHDGVSDKTTALSTICRAGRTSCSTSSRACATSGCMKTGSCAGRNRRSCAAGNGGRGTIASKCPARISKRPSQIQVSVTVGTITHKLKVGGNDHGKSTTIPADTPSGTTASTKGARRSRAICRKSSKTTAAR